MPPHHSQAVSIDCPHCTRQITVRPTFTIKQQNAVKALADPKNRTQEQAAQVAGVHRQTIVRLLQDQTFSLAVIAELEKRSDKARGSLERIAAVKEKAWRRLETLTEGDIDGPTAAVLAKLATDSQKAEHELRALTGDYDSSEAKAAGRQRWKASVMYAIRLGIRAYQRFGPTVIDGIPARVERRALTGHKM